MHKECIAMKTDRNQQPRRFYSRPADESLAAYEEWIPGMTLALGGCLEGDITEEEWHEAWRKFRASADPAASSGRATEEKA
jgi:hypothetical protein